jgi:hypothetical protein
VVSCCFIHANVDARVHLIALGIYVMCCLAWDWGMGMANALLLCSCSGIALILLLICLIFPFFLTLLDAYKKIFCDDLIVSSLSVTIAICMFLKLLYF